MVRTLGIVLFRALGLVGALSFVVAVGVGRMVPAEFHARILGGTPPMLLERGSRGTFDAAVFVDPATGRTEELRLPSRDILENARCSPWTDREGRRQVVGRWSQFSGRADDLVVSRVGLARYSYPDGVVLDYVETGVLPFRSPCWYPDTSAKVLYAAGDGQLYRFAFENAVIGKDSPQLKPELIALRPGVFGADRLHLSGPCWPADSRLGGRLLVSMTNLDDCDSEGMARSSIWWVKLNRAGNEVVEAGRVTGASLELAEGSPAVGMARDGTIYLAYLGQRERTSTWSLLVAPLRIDPDSGRLWTSQDETIELASGLSPESPVFSPDARYVMAQRPFWGERPGLTRLALPMATEGENARAVSAGKALGAD